MIENGHPFPGNPGYFNVVFYGEPPAGGWPARFAVITASFPRANREATVEENARANANLKAAILSKGFHPFALTGASPDFLHREEGWGFATADPAPAVELCEMFDQDAFFWVEDGQVYLAIDETGRGWRVGSWHERLLSHLTPPPATDETR
jgi:hypothetical protein